MNGGLSLRTSELENIFILYIPKIFSKKIISSITFLSGGVFESGFIYEEIKGMERLYGHGNCYLFSTLFYSLSPKYQKYASLDLKKKLKNNRIKNPGITPLIRKFKPSWLKSREDLIKSYDIYIFEHKGKTYYALDIVFDKDLVENKTKEVYDLFVKIAKAIQ